MAVKLFGEDALLLAQWSWKPLESLWKTGSFSCRCCLDRNGLVNLSLC